MAHHVLVLAMSTLKEDILNKSDESQQDAYKLMRDSELVGNLYRGVGQLEAIPQFISDLREGSEGPKKSITHVIIMATAEACEPCQFARRSPEDTFQNIMGCHWKNIAYENNVSTISAVEFFICRMKKLAEEEHFAIDVADENYILVPIDQGNLSAGLGELQDRIRALYAQSKSDPNGDWELWLDTHGSFREISMAMFGVMQMLAAPDESEIKDYMRTTPATTLAVSKGDMIKRMGDGKNTVPVSGVYTVNYSEKPGTVASIVDLTAFYNNFISSSVRAYLNYGQFVQLSHLPDAWEDVNGERNYHKYVFVSYKHKHGEEGSSMSEVYAVLGTMRNAGIHYWYDDAIDVGVDWKAELDEALGNCTWFIALLTRDYLKAPQCIKELAIACEQGKNPILMAIDNSVELYSLDADVSAVVDGVTYTVTKEQFEKLTKVQQVQLVSYIQDGAYQESALEEKLKRRVEDS